MYYIRETLLGQLAVYVKTIKDEFHQNLSTQTSAPVKGKDLPCVVNTIVWTRQLEAKVVDIVASVDSMLSDLASYKPFRQLALNLADEMQEHQQDSFDSWCRDTLSAINDKTNPLRYGRGAHLCSVNKVTCVWSLLVCSQTVKLWSSVTGMGSFRCITVIVWWHFRGK